ncbi:S8 family serine peptidase [Myxococcota bacterium]|nr:S8 family serine peptidase [Myxococcota bacterium]
MSLLVLLAVKLAPTVEAPADDAPSTGTTAPQALPAQDAPVLRAPTANLAPALPSAEVYSSRELVVVLTDPALADAVAADHNTRLRRRVGPSGVAPIVVPDGVEAEALRAQLAADPRVKSVSRSGLMRGAGGGDCSRGSSSSSSSSAVSYQWHLDSAERPSHSGALSGYVVAIIDSGVAYEDYSDASGTYTTATSLASTTIVSPYDFVDDDEHANDAHQHGTHIATTIAGDGVIEGVAPGVSLMPLRVLNAENTGEEADLIDAIVWAVDSGADVINMSLVFSEGYAPGIAMRDALEYAADAGVVMVGAAGNDGGQIGLFPAASPLVIGVSASTLKSKGGSLTLTDYSNISPAMDLVAPGGDLTKDKNKDGYPDGILAETFTSGDPTDMGLWFYSGSSQAAAVVSGAVVYLLDAGITDPGEIGRALQLGAEKDYGSRSFRDGGGAGNLDIDEAVDVADDALRGREDLSDPGFHVSLLPYLVDSKKDHVRPALRVTAIDDNGDPVDHKDFVVVGTRTSAAGTETFQCTLDRDGICDVEGDSERASTKSGDVPLAWGFTIDAIVHEDDEIAYRPGSVIYVTNAFVVLVEAMSGAGVIQDHLMAVSWEAGRDSELGKIEEAFAVSHLGVSRATLPEAVLFNAQAVADIGTWDTVDLDIDGTGLITDPLSVGIITIPRLTLDLSGSGLITDPLSIGTIRLLTFSGSGLITDPLSFKLPEIFAPSFMGAGLITDPLSFTGSPVRLRDGSQINVSEPSLDSFALGSALDDGGWLLGGDGHLGTTALMASGAIGLGGSSSSLTSTEVGSEAY